MEGFLEANRVVEVSLSKLGQIHKSGELPLRRTLLISKTLNRAQDAATTAHYSFLRSPSLTSTPTSSSSSKLLASISKKVEDSSVNESATSTSDPRLSKQSVARQQSSIVSYSALARPGDEPMETEMDFVNVTNSVLSEVFSDTEMTAVSDREMAPSESDRDEEALNASNSWDWQFEFNSARDSSAVWRWDNSDDSTGSLPVSPGKRNHQEAFPFEKETLFFTTDNVDDPKRFKPTPPEGCPLESLPGFCGYLSPKNLQAAPLITYMFGKGFAEPSDPASNGWPACFSGKLSSEKRLTQDSPAMTFTPHNHFDSPLPIHSPSVKCSPILAF